MTEIGIAEDCTRCSPATVMALSRDIRQKAGHYEVLGETLAKFEFFESGWNPYERYLDVDKVDLILRRLRKPNGIQYREVQVKYGKLYECTYKWEKPLFDRSSWRRFREDEFRPFINRHDFFLAYVLAPDSGYEKDIFILPIAEFDALLQRCVSSEGIRTVWISRSIADRNRWYLRLKGRFDEIVEGNTCIEVTKYRRNFELLDR